MATPLLPEELWEIVQPPLIGEILDPRAADRGSRTECLTRFSTRRSRRRSYGEPAGDVEDAPPAPTTACKRRSTAPLQPPITAPKDRAEHAVG